MGLIVDNFAGGGGASTGIEAALGRAVDIAINHDEEAIRMHEVNHPATFHIRNNIWQVDPREVCRGEPVDLAWFSPDCKHFSKAKGGKPREKSIRDLAWVVVLWAKRVRPKLILLENVEEFQTWGPLDANGYPIKERAGEEFAKWCRELRKLGYKIEFRELRACDYGAPTIRKRFFMVARCDGEAIVWPEPTHAPANDNERERWIARQRKAGFKVPRPDLLKPWRTAAEIIDWSIPCPSIFERKKPLADKTLRRVAHGVMRFVVNNPRPFIVPLTHHGSAGRSYDGNEPLPTITAAHRGEMAAVIPHITKFRAGAVGHDVGDPLHTVTANSFVKRPGGSAPLGVVETEISPVIVGCGGRRGQSAPVGPEQPMPTATAKADACVVAASLAQMGYGERDGQAPRALDPTMPLGTVVAGGGKHAAVAAMMQKFADNGVGYDPEEPLHTVMAGAPRHAVVGAALSKFRGSNEKGGGGDLNDPTPTVTAGGLHQAVICAHMEQANGSPPGEKPLVGRAADAPLATIVAKGCTQRLVETTLLEEGDLPPEVMDRAVRTAAFLIKYYGNEQDGHGLDAPIGTVTVQDRFAVVMVTVEAVTYVIVDIGLRMLVPRELFNAQGFPPDYVIEYDACGKAITKTAQVAKCGNSVCPPLAEALARANWRADNDDAEAVAA